MIVLQSLKNRQQIYSMPRKKKRARYGSYCEEIKGKLYGSVQIPLGNGKYKRKRKQVESPIAARQWAEHQLNRTRYGDTEDVETFGQLAEWYKKEFLVPPIYQDGKRIDGLRTYQQQRNLADRLSKQFGGYRLDAITLDTLRRYKRERLRTVSITSVNRDFALLKTMFRRAVTRKWMRENPFEFGEGLLETSLESKGRAKITHRIAKRLLARSRKSEQPLLHYLVLVLAHTGARPSEAFPYQATKNDGILREPLTWRAILDHDFQAVTLVSYKGKVRKERAVPTSVELKRGLRQFYAETQPEPEDVLFPFSTAKRSWATLCRAVGANITLRALRTYFNECLVEKGYDEVSRMLLMGHEHLTTNLLYSSITPEFIKRFRGK